MMKNIPLLLVGLFFLAHCSGKPPANIGLMAGGELHPCPQSPNCVSSQSADKEHYIEPIHYEVSLTEARQKLVRMIRQQQRSLIITNEETYIHAEFRSAVFRFVDDVEFYIDDAAKVIHCRSASRTGHSDFGVNRKRLERLSSAFKQAVNSGR